MKTIGEFSCRSKSGDSKKKRFLESHSQKGKRTLLKSLLFCFALCFYAINSNAGFVTGILSGKCGVCKGSGIITCLLCYGNGGSAQWRCLTYPPYTQYTEWVPCVACQGEGAVLCTWCDGTGDAPDVSEDSSNQYQSGGYNGTYNNYNSNSSSGSGTYSTCRICHGTTVCTSCGGKGGETRDTGYYTGSGNKSWISCPSCNGSKKCFNCHGTGRQ